MPAAILPFLLLVVPILEIAVFIVVGREIGVWWTLGGVFATAVLGTYLLRRQGFAILRRIQEESAQGAIPGRALGEGAMLLVAGILLLTPGFVTDAVGFGLFVPGVRGAIWRFLAARLTQVVTVRAAGFAGARGFAQPRDRDARHGDVIDLDEDDFRDLTPDPNSPWAEGERDMPDGPRRDRS